MNKIIGIGLVGLGLYWAWKQGLFAAQQTTETNTVPATGAIDLSTTKMLMLQKAQKNDFYVQNNGMLNWHQWNYIHQQVRGVGVREPEGIDANLTMTLDEWFRLAYGSGLGRIDEYIRSGGPLWSERASIRFLL